MHLVRGVVRGVNVDIGPLLQQSSYRASETLTVHLGGRLIHSGHGHASVPKSEDILKTDRGHLMCVYSYIKTPHPSNPVCQVIFQLIVLVSMELE